MRRKRHTEIVHAHRAGPGEPVSPPIHTASTWVLRSAEEGAALASSIKPDAFYARWGSPTVAALEQAIAELERAPGALAFSSGMAAISCAVLASARAGDQILVSPRLYGGTAHLMHEVMPTLGIRVTTVEPSADALGAAIRPETKLIYVETPSNPVLGIVDLQEVAAVGSSHGILTMVDNTYASPWNQQPRSLGIDVVLHSATKALGGHSDVVAGVVAADTEFLERLWKVRSMFGSTLSPHDAWLVMRGIKTLGVRQERATATASALAHWLRDHDAVSAVYYPGLSTHPGHDIAARQMTGFGSMLAFEVERREDAARVLDHLAVFTHAVSLGGVESLVTHPATTTHATLDDAALQKAGIAPGLIRISVGLEDLEDLQGDLKQALQLIA